MKTNIILKKTFTFAMVTLASFSSVADVCFSDHFTHIAPVVGSKGSARQTASAQGTWEDWIWQGPIFECSSSAGGGDCTYRWDNTKYTEYSWATGITLTLPNIPLTDKLLGGFAVNGSFTKLTGWSSTYSVSQIIHKGWYARPVQIVDRQWSTGNFRGGYRLRKDSSCNDDNGSLYWWDPNVQFGKWQAHVEVNRRQKYHIWQKGT